MSIINLYQYRRNLHGQLDIQMTKVTHLDGAVLEHAREVTGQLLVKLSDTGVFTEQAESAWLQQLEHPVTQCDTRSLHVRVISLRATSNGIVNGETYGFW